MHYSDTCRHKLTENMALLYRNEINDKTVLLRDTVHQTFRVGSAAAALNTGLPADSMD